MYRMREDYRNTMYRGGRSFGVGLRFGEMERQGAMERDACFAHGLPCFLRKRLLADQDTSIKPHKPPKEQRR